MPSNLSWDEKDGKSIAKNGQNTKLGSVLNYREMKDETSTIAFVQSVLHNFFLESVYDVRIMCLLNRNVNMRRFSQLKGLFQVGAELPSMMTIMLFCVDQKLKFAVSNAHLRLIKPQKK